MNYRYLLVDFNLGESVPVNSHYDIAEFYTTHTKKDPLTGKELIDPVTKKPIPDPIPINSLPVNKDFELVRVQLWSLKDKSTGTTPIKKVIKLNVSPGICILKI